MGNADHHQSSSGAAVVAVVAAVLLLLFGGLVVVGVGAWFFMRTQARETEMRAVMQAEQARAMAEKARATAMTLEAQARRTAERAEVETAPMEAEAATETAVADDEMATVEARQRAEEAEAELRATRERLDRLSREKAHTEQALKNAMAEAAEADASGQTPPTSTAMREVIVELNQNGEIQAFGRAVDRDTLKTTLLQSVTDPGAPVTVRLRIDRRCEFGDVADLQSLCHEAGVSRVSLSAVEE